MIHLGLWPFIPVAVLGCIEAVKWAREVYQKTLAPIRAARILRKNRRRPPVAEPIDEWDRWETEFRNGRKSS